MCWDWARAWKSCLTQFEGLRESGEELEQKQTSARVLNKELERVWGWGILELRLRREQLLLDDRQVALPVNEELQMNNLWLDLKQLVSLSFP